MTRIVIADDHTFFRSGVEAALRAFAIDVVASVEDGNAALAAIAECDPDMVILDINMPGRGGVSTLQEMRAAGDERPVIILAAELRDDALVAIINAGANAILLKAGAELRLLDAIEAIEEGSRFIDAALLERAFQVAQKNTKSSVLDELSPRERQIVSEIAQGRRNKEIADRLKMTEGTIKVYLHNIYKRLGIKSRTELAVMLLDLQDR